MTIGRTESPRNFGLDLWRAENEARLRLAKQKYKFPFIELRGGKNVVVVSISYKISGRRVGFSIDLYFLDCKWARKLLVYTGMEYTPFDSRIQLAEQERRVRSLEEELAQCRAAVNLLRAELVSEGLDTPLPELPAEKGANSGYLAPMQPGDPLSRKWKLGEGLVYGTSASPQAAGDDRAEKHTLRLYGLLSGGTPWQASIPFNQLAQYGGCTIGRSEDLADIVLADPGISRCHARLELTDDGLVVTDENSTNGVWVNDIKLNAYERQRPLEDGSTLVLGNILLRTEYN